MFFSRRSKDVEWVPFLTIKLVDDFAAHLKLFGLAIEHCEKQKEEGKTFFYLRAYCLMCKLTWI
jgi:hypothetical protein